MIDDEHWHNNTDNLYEKTNLNLQQYRMYQKQMVMYKYNVVLIRL